MSNQGKNPKCQMGCWIAAAVAGAFAFFMLLSVSGYSFFAALFLGAIVCVLLGVLFDWLFCTAAPHVPYEPAAAAPISGSASAAPAAVPAATAKEVAAAPVTAKAEASTSAAAPVETVAQEPAPAKAPEAPAAVAQAETVEAAPKVVPSATLAGQDELAATKGEWKYEAPAEDVTEAPVEKPAAKKKAPAKKKAAPKKAAAKATKATTDQDFDGDGKIEGSEEGTKPATLSAARDGGADDLKRIKGIGPKLEILCNELGFYHFDQISNWTADEIAWVNANLAGFKGRVTRDNWVEQATLLAAGKETEFSQRVDKGSVY